MFPVSLRASAVARPVASGCRVSEDESEGASLGIPRPRLALGTALPPGESLDVLLRRGHGPGQEQDGSPRACRCWDCWWGLAAVLKRRTAEGASVFLGFIASVGTGRQKTRTEERRKADRFPKAL